ncbi:MAG TPA: methyltransferase domain-containing protein [Methylomirabilota bacterium]|jgi:SAM-dependent methyltransferase|nr:methyltransferase domain-containing protein [Methylomirabilota bacterium]
MPDFSELKQRHRAVWASGDYDRIARGIQAVADHVVRSAGIRAGERVLDVACGTGNTALMARARGAAVTGLDLTPDLLAVAEKRAAEAGFDDITWKEGDAEDLPFPDGAFDVVVSSCGLMFAPDQAKVASEVGRVTRRGGRIAIQAWTREGGVGRMFKVTNGHVAPPPGVPSPFEWGDEAKVKSLLGASFKDYRFERYDCPEYADTPEALADLFIGQFGPTHRAYQSLAPDRAAAFRKDLIDLYRSYITPADGKVRWGREYVITLASRA